MGGVIDSGNGELSKKVAELQSQLEDAKAELALEREKVDNIWIFSTFRSYSKLESKAELYSLCFCVFSLWKTRNSLLQKMQNSNIG